MRAIVLRQIPDPHATAPIAANNLSLVRVDHDVVDRGPMVVVPLDRPAPRLPDLDGAVLGRRHHPLSLAVEGHARHVSRVTLEGEHGVGVRRLDVVELNGVVARRGEVALVGGDAEPVDLRFGVLDRAGADTREGLPEPASSSVSSWFPVGSLGMLCRFVYVCARLMPGEFRVKERTASCGHIRPCRESQTSRRWERTAL